MNSSQVDVGGEEARALGGHAVHLQPDGRGAHGQHQVGRDVQSVIVKKNSLHRCVVPVARGSQDKDSHNLSFAFLDMSCQTFI